MAQHFCPHRPYQEMVTNIRLITAAVWSKTFPWDPSASPKKFCSIVFLSNIENISLTCSPTSSGSFLEYFVGPLLYALYAMFG